MCPREGLGSAAVTVEPSRRRSVAISSVQSDALQDMSMARLAGAIPPHDCINMDTSDARVCGVWHSQKKFFALQWNDGEKECIRRFKERSDSAFGIKYRELSSRWYYDVPIGEEYMGRMLISG